MQNKAPKILIVDDEKPIVNLIRRALLKDDPDYNIYAADDGFEAGKQISVYKPDLVILDLMLPKIDGFSICKNIKSDDTTRHTKVLVITGFPSDARKKRILSCGADDYLEKPFDIEVLIEKLHDLLAG